MKKLHIGFTGTAEGMTTWQMNALEKLFQTTADSGAQVDSFHHGDCVGADAQAHIITSKFGHKIVIHPPINDSRRAHCRAEIILPPKDYLERNHDIVDIADVMFATPKGYEEEQRSGTWATIRYARKLGRRLIIIYPDGSRWVC